MKAEQKNFPCPSCGFEVFSAPPGSYEICELCGWEDDHVQLRFPAMAGGANKASLAEHQLQVLAAYPTTVALAKGFRRSKEWRPFWQARLCCPSHQLQGRNTSMPLQQNLRGTIGCIMYRANKPLVPTRNGEAPLLAAQRRR
jgi:hypothetical protein